MSERSPAPTDPSASRHRKHHLRTPSPELSHGDKLLRESMHRRILTGVLVILLAAALVAVAFDLTSWAGWVVLAAICVTVIGVIIAISPRRRA
jgi:membrane protein YdbS with pleckstrin-like domain